MNFAYGRRGSTLNTGSKTPNPVTFAQATTVYEKLVKSKSAKGYVPVAGGDAQSGTGYADGDRPRPA